MDHLYEQVFTVNTLDLTDFQKILLAKAFNVGAINNNMQHVDLDDTKLTAARDILSDMDIITYDYENDTLSITQPGLELLKRTGIIDDSDQLTDDGKTYAEGKIPNPDQANDTTQESISFKQYLNLV